MAIRPSREDRLSFNRHGRDQLYSPPTVAYVTKARPPRSFSDSAVRSIAAQAQKRSPGEMFPMEVDEEDTLIPLNSQQTSSAFNIALSLTKKQRAELEDILHEFKECISDGSTIGHVKNVSARIKTDGPLPLPQPNHPHN